MRQFRWISARDIPHGYDLRRRGWRLAGGSLSGAHALSIPVLCDAAVSPLAADQGAAPFLEYPRRKLTLLLGVERSNLRARYLRLGFGDVAGYRADLPEIEARALRLARNASRLPASRHVGALQLDLLARDGFVGERPLGLHPREFELIWRLAETPGEAVNKEVLVKEVWHMAHVPDTNSVAVHVSRLRAKLGGAGIGGLVQTAPSGGYFVAPPSAIPLQTGTVWPGDEWVDHARKPGNKLSAPAAEGYARHEARICTE